MGQPCDVGVLNGLLGEHRYGSLNHGGWHHCVSLAGMIGRFELAASPMPVIPQVPSGWTMYTGVLHWLAGIGTPSMLPQLPAGIPLAGTLSVALHGIGVPFAVQVAGAATGAVDTGFAVGLLEAGEGDVTGFVVGGLDGVDEAAKGADGATSVDVTTC